jgi:hypothetical protein
MIKPRGRNRKIRGSSGFRVIFLEGNWRIEKQIERRVGIKRER